MNYSGDLVKLLKIILTRISNIAGKPILNHSLVTLTYNVIRLAVFVDKTVPQIHYDLSNIAENMVKIFSERLHRIIAPPTVTSDDTIFDRCGTRRKN